MWLVGGGLYIDLPDPSIDKNDLWRSEHGPTWERVGDAPWEPRRYHAVLVLKGHLVVLAGYAGRNLADGWVSRDGSGWLEIPVPWAARHALSATVHKGHLLIMGGPLDDQRVWALR